MTRRPRFPKRLNMSHMQLTSRIKTLKNMTMPEFQPVTITEVAQAYDTLIGKARAKRRVLAGFRGFSRQDDPAVYSLLPVGCDGLTTVHLERDQEKKKRLFLEIVRMFNENVHQTEIPKFRLKRFSVREKTEKGENGDKVRTTVLLCLRDQIAMRVLLNRITRAGIVTGKRSDMYGQIESIVKDLRSRRGRPVIVKTDIKSFHPSVDRQKLIELLHTEAVDQLDERTLTILEHVIAGHSSADKVTGLPLGLSVSVILAEFYAQQMRLPSLVPGVSVYRYADDIVMIADEGTNPSKILSALDRRLSAFGLIRNEPKTNVPADGAFDYLGVQFQGTRLSIKEGGLTRWENSVWAEVERDYESYLIASSLKPDGGPMPDRKKLIRDAFKEYKRGPRSSYWKFTRRVLALNECVELSVAA